MSNLLLKELLKNIEFELLQGELEPAISSIHYDSRTVVNDSLFVAIKGFQTDGHIFICQAIQKGASVIILEDEVEVPKGITVLKVKQSRKVLALLSSAFYGNPAEKLTLIGITGTNGKTTTSFILKSLLDSMEVKTGLVGTTGYYIGEEKLEASHTTPESLELHQLFAKMVCEDVKVVIMEVSSHSLSMDRVFGLNFKIGVFTNLTQDHLDFHKTMENYREAKAILFENLSEDSFAILNEDDINSNFFRKVTKAKTFTYGQSPKADLTASSPKFDLGGTSFKLVFDDSNYNVRTNLLGKFNLSNTLASLLTIFTLQLNKRIIIESLEKVQTVEGRFEIIRKNKLTAIVDYAHTPDALEKIILSVREVTNGKIILVFGCGGDRDKEKRPLMGKIATELADKVIITSDNPRTENPLGIIENIVKGLEANSYQVIPNRKEAIGFGVKILNLGDVLIVAGKGHETYQIIGREKSHFDDREEIRKAFERN
ncbi:MAG: UDP-N-acetylmuramoyl-L-alanyl-D-glutamate--2,6-diaminopimelate ligase [Calditrichaeota bacterium]|nr:MAG: UDP-N-acetylmuramoyl-L-alanyl-D-glutamate--2,6-diaminopimelate ligase [Calditrichota bacterium]